MLIMQLLMIVIYLQRLRFANTIFKQTASIFSFSHTREPASIFFYALHALMPASIYLSSIQLLRP